MFNLLKGLMNSAPATDFKELVKNGAVIVDVRTPGEYRTGHIKGSINIPLDVLATQTASLAKKNVPVITCCRSGGRSGAAIGILKSAGIEAFNGGPWDSLESKI